MKKILITVLAVLFLAAGQAFAFDWSAEGILQQITKIPDVVRTGGAVAMTKADRGEVYSLTTVDFMGWGKGKFGLTDDIAFLGGGLATNFRGDNLEALTLSGRLGGLERLGISFPFSKLVKDVEVGGYVGKDLINTGDVDAPISAGLQVTARF